MSEPQTFLSRVYDAKHRFEMVYYVKPTELFLGPKEYLELREYVKQLEKDGLIIRHTDSERAIRDYRDALAGMIVIGLAYDGMRAGISSTCSSSS